MEEKVQGEARDAALPRGRLGCIGVLPLGVLCSSGVDSFANGGLWQGLGRCFLRPSYGVAPERLESAWLSLLSAAETGGQKLALREDYAVRSPYAGLLWAYRRHSAGGAGVVFARSDGCFVSSERFSLSGDLWIDPPLEMKDVLFLNDSYVRNIECVAPVPRARIRLSRALPFHDADLFP